MVVYGKVLECRDETEDSDKWETAKKKNRQMADLAEKRKRRMVRRQIDGGCHSPLPEMVRSCVRKLSWTCDSDRVV